MEKIEVRIEKNGESDNATAYVNGCEVAWASILTSEDSPAYVERIDVDEAERGKGIGTEMLEKLASHYDEIIIAADNERANRLYERLGSEYTGEDAPYVDQGYGVWMIR